MYKPYGMISALPTPMLESGEIDYESYGKLIEHVISGGIHGVLDFCVALNTVFATHFTTNT